MAHQRFENMQTRYLWHVMVFFFAAVVPGSTPARAQDLARGLDLLRRDALGPISITGVGASGIPTFVRARIPVRVLDVPVGTDAEIALAFATRYADLVRIGDPRENLRRITTEVGPLGMRHVRFQQVYAGLDVYGATLGLHFDRDGNQVVAITNGVVPDVRLRSATPLIDADAAIRVARRRMRSGTVESTVLVVYPDYDGTPQAWLAWIVHLRDDAAPARKAFIVHARAGRILDELDRLYVSRDRKTYSAENGAGLPGSLRRSEGDSETGDSDIDRAHDFAGDTYDYFSDTHGRDSYDNLGAALSSTAHYRTNFQNAFWNGRQMVYGDGYAVQDVAAHEMTHAVTEYSAKLEYRWQSGALNESFSDIFAAMVDRDDWLIGEDLPGGPIRNMANPGQFNHPGHADDWRAICNDNEGVHINSGIHNKAYVNVAESIGKDKAEQVFYRALTTYLETRSTFEDARSAALQSASDLFGEESTEYEAVNGGFTAVGIDGSFDPGPGGCSRARPVSPPDEFWITLALIFGFFGLLRTARYLRTT